MDSDWTFERLAAEGFSATVIAALDAVTKRARDEDPHGDDAETRLRRYLGFVTRAATNDIGRKVKIADLEDNLDLSRIASPTPKDVAQAEKCRAALEILRSLPRQAVDLVRIVPSRREQAQPSTRRTSRPDAGFTTTPTASGSGRCRVMRRLASNRCPSAVVWRPLTIGAGPPAPMPDAALTRTPARLGGIARVQAQRDDAAPVELDEMGGYAGTKVVDVAAPGDVGGHEQHAGELRCASVLCTTGRP